MPKDDLNELHFSRLQVKGQHHWVTLALISNIANYLKYNYFLDCGGIDNVTLRLWKFSDFCSKHTVSVAGDDIMFHILVSNSIHSLSKLLWKVIFVYPLFNLPQLYPINLETHVLISVYRLVIMPLISMLFWNCLFECILIVVPCKAPDSKRHCQHLRKLNPIWTVQDEGLNL